MKLWMSAEVFEEIAEALRVLFMQIETQMNQYLEDINYKNDQLTDWDIIITLRDDNVFDEIIKYSKKKKDTDFHLKIPYGAFKNGTDKERANLIYDLLTRSLDILEEKGVRNLEVVKKFIVSSKH